MRGSIWWPETQRSRSTHPASFATTTSPCVASAIISRGAPPVTMVWMTRRFARSTTWTLPSNVRLAYNLTFDGKVQVVDRANRRVIQTIVTGGAPRLMIADATQGLVVVANEAGWVDLLR